MILPSRWIGTILLFLYDINGIEEHHIQDALLGEKAPFLSHTTDRVLLFGRCFV